MKVTGIVSSLAPCGKLTALSKASTALQSSSVPKEIFWEIFEENPARCNGLCDIFGVWSAAAVYFC